MSRKPGSCLKSAIYQTGPGSVFSRRRSPEVNGLNLSVRNRMASKGESDKLSMTVNGTAFTAALADNCSARALWELLGSGVRALQFPWGSENT